MTEASVLGSKGTDSPARSAIAPVVERARARLARSAGRRLVLRAAPFIAALALVACAIRPLVWPLDLDSAPGALGVGEGMARGIAIALVCSGLLGLAAFVIGRRRPTMLRAARAIDEASKTPDVLASGYAFEAQARDGAVVSLARVRAERLAIALDLTAVFPLPRVVPRRRTVLRWLPFVLLAIAAAGFDPVVVGGFFDPPSSAETATADALSVTAEVVREALATPEREERPGARDRREAASERRRTLAKIAERADRASTAARRADRSRALEELDALARDGERMRDDERSLDRSLRELARSLREQGARDGSTRPSSPSSRSSSSEELRLLARQLREERAGTRTEAEQQRMLERLSRAEQALRREGERDRPGAEESQRAADALREALDRLSRDDRQAAAEALREASERVAELEAMRREASELGEALAELLDRSGALERALARAMTGAEPREGEGEPMLALGSGAPGGDEAALEAFRRSLAERLSKMGGGSPSGQPGSALNEPHIADRGGERRRGLEPGGDLHARSQVREGERATQAIAGLGAQGEPTSAYRDVYPQYGAIAEEAMADESVPVIRRAAVRRYFEGIRPDRTEAMEER
jgi:hypothetical protein